MAKKKQKEQIHSTPADYFGDNYIGQPLTPPPDDADDLSKEIFEYLKDFKYKRNSYVPVTTDDVKQQLINYWKQAGEQVFVPYKDKDGNEDGTGYWDDKIFINKMVYYMLMEAMQLNDILYIKRDKKEKLLPTNNFSITNAGEDEATASRNVRIIERTNEVRFGYDKLYKQDELKNLKRFLKEEHWGEEFRKVMEEQKEYLEHQLSNYDEIYKDLLTNNVNKKETKKVINNNEQTNNLGDNVMTKKTTNKQTRQTNKKETKQTKRHIGKGRTRRTKAEIEEAKKLNEVKVKVNEVKVKVNEVKNEVTKEVNDEVNEELMEQVNDLEERINDLENNEFTMERFVNELNNLYGPPRDQLSDALNNVYDPNDYVDLDQYYATKEDAEDLDERVTNLEAGMEATSSDEVNKLKEENKQLMEKYEELNNKYEELYALIINKEPAANNDEVNELKQRVSDLEAKNKELNEKINLFEFEHNHMLNSNKEVLDAVSNVSEHTANMEQQLKEQKIYNEVKDKNISELRATIINQELTINNLNERFGTYIYKQQQRERELNTVKGATKNLVKATIITPINRFKKYLSNRKVNKYNKMIEKLNKLKEKELNKWNNEGEE